MAINLQHVPIPQILEGISYNEVLSAIRDNFQARSPDYTSIVESDPGYALLEACSFIGTLFFSQIDDAVKAVLITHATGTNLEVLAAGFNVERRDEESDTELRQRTIDTLETLVPGSHAWYKNYALEASTNVKDARIYRKPDPNDPDEDIPGEVNVYLQGKETAVPDNTTLQAVKDYIHAVGGSWTDPEAETAAEQRRFICDTVNVEAISTLSYILCADIHVLPGLVKSTILEEIQNDAQDFVDEEAKIGNKIPLSSIYAVLDTDTVSEVTLLHPTTDVEPDRDTVPIALEEQELDVQEYKTFDTWLNFGLTTDAGWSLAEYNSEWYILFTQDITDADNDILNDIKTARRFSVYSTDDDGNEDELLYTYRVADEKDEYENPSNTDNPDDRVHSYFELTEEPERGDLTVGDDYILKARNSIEIRAIGL